MNTGDAQGGGHVGRLAAVVRGEALRDEAHGRVRADPTRLAAGWTHRFVIERARVPDFVRLYEATGFEVALDPVPPELLDDECLDCRLVAALEYVSVYTRRRADADGTPPPAVAREEAGGPPHGRSSEDH